MLLLIVLEIGKCAKEGHIFSAEARKGQEYTHTHLLDIVFLGFLLMILFLQLYSLLLNNLLGVDKT